MASKYIPFTQQPYCCTPTCIQMVMYRHGIPLRSQEDIGYEIGLTVPDEDKHLFGKVRTGDKPKAGWGTQISVPEFGINPALSRLQIPLTVETKLISEIESSKQLLVLLSEITDSDGDALLCFNYGKLWDKDTDSGHVCVFDRIEIDKVWMIDPERAVPKYREVTIAKLYESMKSHGPEKSGGVWIFRKN